jgi:hypothetical protein
MDLQTAAFTAPDVARHSEPPLRTPSPPRGPPARTGQWTPTCLVDAGQVRVPVPGSLKPTEFGRSVPDLPRRGCQPRGSSGLGQAPG